MTEKRYYWLKLKRDFFKRHDIRIIESMPNGKDYVLFYLKLLLESVDHDGQLRFSDTIPYDENMLSIIANTNIDIVRSAMKIFIKLGLMEILDDQTIYLDEANKLLGCEGYSAERMRNTRNTQKHLINSEHCAHNLQKSDLEIEIEKEKELEIDTEIESMGRKRPQSRFLKPSVEEIRAYCQERNNGIDAQHFWDWYETKGWMIGKNHMKDWKAAVRTWEQRDTERGRPPAQHQPQSIVERIANL